jgi:hypothetical protein
MGVVLRLAPVKKNAYLPVKMTPELKKALVDHARTRHRTAGAQARKYIEEGLARDLRKKRGR